MIDGILKEKFLMDLLAGKHKHCTAAIQSLLQQKIPFITIYENLLKYSLYQIGDLWEANKIGVAEEHLASTIVEKLLNDIYPSIQASASVNKKAIITCIENEYHQIGSKMVADTFEKNGWEVLYLGANTPESSLISYVELISPGYVAISVSIYFHFHTLDKLLKKLQNLFPNVNILIGGQAFNHIPQNQLPTSKNIEYLKDLHQIDSYLKTIQL